MQCSEAYHKGVFRQCILSYSNLGFQEKGQKRNTSYLLCTERKRKQTVWLTLLFAYGATHFSPKINRRYRCRHVGHVAERTTRYCLDSRGTCSRRITPNAEAPLPASAVLHTLSPYARIVNMLKFLRWPSKQTHEILLRIYVPEVLLFM